MYTQREDGMHGIINSNPDHCTCVCFDRPIPNFAVKIIFFFWLSDFGAFAHSASRALMDSGTDVKQEDQQCCNSASNFVALVSLRPSFGHIVKLCGGQTYSLTRNMRIYC